MILYSGIFNETILLICDHCWEEKQFELERFFYAYLSVSRGERPNRKDLNFFIKNNLELVAKYVSEWIIKENTTKVDSPKYSHFCCKKCSSLGIKKITNFDAALKLKKVASNGRESELEYKLGVFQNVFNSSISNGDLQSKHYFNFVFTGNVKDTKVEIQVEFLPNFQGANREKISFLIDARRFYGEDRICSKEIFDKYVYDKLKKLCVPKAKVWFYEI